MNFRWWHFIPMAFVSAGLWAASPPAPLAETDGEEVTVTLESAAEMVFANDPTLESYRARRRAQQHKQTRALLRMIPQVSVAATLPIVTVGQVGGTTGDTTFFSNYPDPIGFVGVQVRQDLWNGGRNWADYALAYDEEDSFAAEGDFRKFRLRQDLVISYYSALRDRRMVEFREGVVQTLQRMRLRAGNYFRAQAIGRVDRGRIEIAYRQAAQERDYALFLAAETEQRLARLLRLKAGQRILFNDDFPSVDDPLPTITEMRDHPVQRRYEANDRVLRDIRRKEISSGLPQLTAYGSYGFRARPGGSLPFDAPKASVGVALVVPITEAFSANAAWNEHEEGVRRNEFERRETINDLRYDREKLTRQVTLVRPLLRESAQETAKILSTVAQITAAYVLGETSIGGWLESFGAVKERKNRHVQLEYDHAVALQGLRALAVPR